MAENVTVARPYAEAALQLAQASSNLPAWESALDRMAAIAADPQMQDCIGNPKILPDQLYKLFMEVVGDKVSAEQKGFVRVLVNNERLGVLSEIHALFAELKNTQEGVKEAHITSAYPLDGAALKKLADELEARFNCKITTTVSVDPELIGGARIAIGDQVIDASVRGKIEAMASALKN